MGGHRRLRPRQGGSSRRLPQLPNGTPGPDASGRAFARPYPVAFAQRLGRWMAPAGEAAGLAPVARGGKSSRRARGDTAAGCPHATSAFATQGRLAPGQAAVEGGRSGAAATPNLLSTLDLAGAIVAVDAAGCQRGGAGITREGGHHLPAVKGNRPGLLRAAEGALARAGRAGYEGVAFGHRAQADGGHGRREERPVAAPHDAEALLGAWPDVRAVVGLFAHPCAGRCGGGR